MFKIKIVDNCLVCSKPTNKKARQRSYCSKKCRDTFLNKKYYWTGGRERDQLNRKKRATESPDRVKCGLCGLWFRKVGSHARMGHKMTARAYREQLNLPVKRGILRNTVRKELADTARANKTDKNLLKGSKNRYKKGDPRTKINTGYKGQYQAVKRLDKEIYE